MNNKVSPGRRSIQVTPPTRRAYTPPVRVSQPRNVDASSLPPIQPMEADIAKGLPSTDAGWATLAGERVVSSIPLTNIPNIGENRAMALKKVGFDSIQKLATAASSELALIPGISAAMAQTFVAEANAILAAPDTWPAPLVSCVMPTYNRRHFASQAIKYFIRQNYPHRELIIVDDGSDPIQDLIPEGKNIRYLRLEQKLTIGEKQNLGCQAAQGSIIAIWDDDVWVDDWRLSYQVGALFLRGADLCGLDNWLHFNPFTGLAWHSRNPSGNQPWMPGTTLCFRKSFWEDNPFPHVQLADILFVKQKPTAKIISLQAIDWLVDIIHHANASPKNTSGPLWQPYPMGRMQKLLGKDWTFYAQLAQHPG